MMQTMHTYAVRDSPTHVWLPVSLPTVPAGHVHKNPSRGAVRSTHSKAMLSQGSSAQLSMSSQPAGPSPLPVIPGGQEPQLKYQRWYFNFSWV